MLYIYIFHKGKLEFRNLKWINEGHIILSSRGRIPIQFLWQGLEDLRSKLGKGNLNFPEELPPKSRILNLETSLRKRMETLFRYLFSSEESIGLQKPFCSKRQESSGLYLRSWVKWGHANSLAKNQVEAAWYTTACSVPLLCQDSSRSVLFLPCRRQLKYCS